MCSDKECLAHSQYQLLGFTHLHCTRASMFILYIVDQRFCSIKNNPYIWSVKPPSNPKSNLRWLYVRQTCLLSMWNYVRQWLPWSQTPSCSLLRLVSVGNKARAPASGRSPILGLLGRPIWIKQITHDNTFKNNFPLQCFFGHTDTSHYFLCDTQHRVGLE